MKVIIDIPKTEFNYIKKVWSKRRGSIPYTNIAFGTPIPDDATNGDVIKALFPNVEIIDEGFHNITVIFGDYRNQMYRNRYDMEWWNSPYIQQAAPYQSNPEEHSCFKCRYLGWENVGDGMTPICEQELYIEDTSDNDSGLHKSEPTVGSKNDCYWFKEKET